MSRRKMPARLWLRERPGREAKYVILDRGKEIFTGYGPRDWEAASDLLDEYNATRYYPKSGKRDPSQVPVADVMSLYMTGATMTPSSMKLVGYHLIPLMKFFGNDSLAEINGQRCQDYITKRGKEVAKSTVRRELVTFQAAINYWHKQFPLYAVPTITKPLESDGRQNYLSRKEAAKLLHWARRLGFHHVARFILIGLYTGTRHTSILKLKWSDSKYTGHIDVAHSRLYRRGSLEGQSKKKRPTSRIPERLMAHLRRWERLDLEKGPQSAIIRWHGKPISKERRAWNIITKKAGLEGIAPHILKHTCITWLLQEGRLEAWDISGLTGTSMKTIENTYGHQDADYQKAAAKAFGGMRR